ncbi:MAG: tetratricopeptide repeat protein [Pseudomonadota bacterium]
MGNKISKPAVLAGLALVVSSAAVTSRVHAQGSSSAVAESLYEDARGLMKQGKLDEACPKFKQSYDLDAGGGTLLNLAECYEKQGKLASAWSAFKEALVTAQRDGRTERIGYAKKHIAALEPKLSKITIQVPSEANTPGLSVTLDGAELGSAAWGVGVPIDAGSHELAASATNKRPFKKHLEIAATTLSTTVTIPELEAEPVASAAAPRAIDADVEKRPVPSEPVAANSSGRTVGFVLLGAGVVGVGVGSYFGLHAFSQWGKRKDGCTPGCTPDAKNAGDSAASSALISDIGFGVGLIAAGVGTYLILSSKPASETGSAGVRHHAQRTLSLLPVANANGGGLWLHGSY